MSGLWVENMASSDYNNGGKIEITIARLGLYNAEKSYHMKRDPLTYFRSDWQKT